MTSSNRCSVCKKINGICSCAGCKAYFCGKDFTEHRGGLRNELDGLSDDSNDLNDKINKTPESNESHISLLTRIDEWQQTTIEKVKQVAEEARKEIIKLMTSEKMQLTNQLESLIQEFKELRETEGFVEQDLTRLKQRIHQMNEDFKNLTQLTIIELHMTQSDQIPWNQFINVRYKKSGCNKNQQRSTINLTSSSLSTSQIPSTPSKNTKSSFFTPDQQKSADEKTSVQLSSLASNTTSQYDTKPSIFGKFNGSSSIFGSSTPLNNTSSSVFGSKASLKPSTNTNGGFSFSGFGNSATAPTARISTTTTSTDTKPTFPFGSTNTPLFGNAPKFSFSELAKQSSSTNNDKPATNGTDQRVFTGQGLFVFGTSSVNTPTTTKNYEDEGGDENESYEPNFSFKQIVQLSAVEVKTGEEDENVLFCERAKLYRFDAESNQMKERGVGEMKILQHKTTKVCRVLMRREQVLKLCANHHITSQMKLKPHQGSENTYVWSAIDFANGEAKYETLCVRFKLGDVAKRFIKEFNEAKQANVNIYQVKLRKTFGTTS